MISSEGRTGTLAAVKLVNVALAMLWGFATTFVFVRLLELSDFRAFLILVAFANFTISAEFGFSNVLYSRLRRKVLDDAGSFASEELGVVFTFMVMVVVLGAAALTLAVSSGWISTTRSQLFLAFYLLSALNLVVTLMRKLLAAIDRNLWWEWLDLARRMICLALLLCALAGLSLELSILLQILVTGAALLVAMRQTQRGLAMPWRHWCAVRIGGGHVRRHYLGDVRNTVLLTLGEAGAYNAPYVTIAALTPDPRPMLLFDFAFKLIRAVTALARAIVETLLPRYTVAYYGRALSAPLLRQILLVTLIMACLCAGGVIAFGRQLSAILFDEHYVATLAERTGIGVALAALGIICVSVYVQSALGRFGRLLPSAAVLLIGSLLVAPAALWIERSQALSFEQAFIALYALLFVAVSVVHWRSMRDLLAGRVP